jgi:hypothetical protein
VRRRRELLLAPAQQGSCRAALRGRHHQQSAFESIGCNLSKLVKNSKVWRKKLFDAEW